MANGQTVAAKTPTKTNKHKAWKIVGITLAIFVGLLLAGWGYKEYQYQQWLNILTKVTNQVWSSVVKPAGGVEENGFPYTKCSHWLDLVGSEGIDCPEVDDVWFVPIEQGKEDAFRTSIFQHGVYNVSNIRLNVSVSDLNGIHAPYPAPAGKEWKLVSASAFEYSVSL